MGEGVNVVARETRVVSIRELHRQTAAVLDDVELEDKEVLVFRYGRPVARMIPVATVVRPRSRTQRARLEPKESAESAPRVDVTERETEILRGVGPTGWYHPLPTDEFADLRRMEDKGLLAQTYAGWQITSLGRRVLASISLDGPGENRAQEEAPMAEFVDAIAAEEVDPETACVVDVDGQEIAIVNTGGTFFAVQNQCTHAAFPIGEGDVIGEGIVECPGHASSFNVVTGEPVNGPATEPLETYDVEVVDGMVRVAIE